TTGISAVVAPDGSELARTDFFQPAYLDAQVRLKTDLTPATRWGPAVQWLFLGIAVAVLAIAIRHNRWFSRQSRRRPRSGADRSEAPAGAPDEVPDDDAETLPDDGADDIPPAEGSRQATRLRADKSDKGAT
ncbi:MAG: hypothetical protein JO106_07915, partial [Mycobacterium sp.]|nr:hypothetical protein [Mycobacterium sp.]